MSLNTEQRCEVARAVTGKPHKAIETPQGGVHIVSPNVELIPGTGILRFPDLHSNEESYTYIPDLKGNERQRSQALALIEWLADRIWKKTPVPEATLKMKRLCAAISDKDIAALEELAFELLENKE